MAATSRRGSEAAEPFVFDNEPVEATVGLVETSWSSGNFLKVDPSSCFQEFDILKLRYMYRIPAAMEIHAPLPHECVDWDIQGWWSVYVFAFEFGFRFLVPKLLREVISHFEIAPSQLMPIAWRILMTLECISMRHDIEFGLGELLYTYFLWEHDHEKGRYNLYV